MTNNFDDRHRLDFKGFEYHVDPVTGETHIRVLFDSARYSIETVDGNQMLIDRQDKMQIPFHLVQRLIAETLSRPPIGKAQELGDAVEYVKSRETAIRARLMSPSEPRQLADPSAEWLSSIQDGLHPFAIVSVDIVGSTKLSERLDPTMYARILGTVQDELAAVCPYFHAHVLKFTGDGVLAYLPAEAFLAANDNAIDCALTMRLLVHDAVNPILEGMGYSRLGLRIGIESGGAVATTLGDPRTKSQRDLIGQTISMACKIQASGHPDEIRIGQVAYQNLHTMWKTGCVPVALPANWNYKLSDGSPYSVHLFVGTSSK